MIRVIRNDGVELLLNTDTIKSIETTSDHRTIITLTTGEYLSVKTPAFDVSQKIKAYVVGITQERRDYDRALREGGIDKLKEVEKAREAEKEKQAELAKAALEAEKEKEKEQDQAQAGDSNRGDDRGRGKGRGKDKKGPKQKSKSRDRVKSKGPLKRGDFSSTKHFDYVNGNVDDEEEVIISYELEDEEETYEEHSIIYDRDDDEELPEEIFEAEEEVSEPEAEVVTAEEPAPVLPPELGDEQPPDLPPPLIQVGEKHKVIHRTRNFDEEQPEYNE